MGTGKSSPCPGNCGEELHLGSIPGSNTLFVSKCGRGKAEPPRRRGQRSPGRENIKTKIKKKIRVKTTSANPPPRAAHGGLQIAFAALQRRFCCSAAALAPRGPATPGRGHRAHATGLPRTPAARPGSQWERKKKKIKILFLKISGNRSLANPAALTGT